MKRKRKKISYSYTDSGLQRNESLNTVIWWQWSTSWW